MQPELTRVERYLRDTRSPVYSCLFVIPLFVLYEILALSLQAFQITSLRNGADVMLRNMASTLGLDRFPILIIFILVALAVMAGYDRRRRKIEVEPGWFALLFIESIFYAMVLGSVALNATNFLLKIPSAMHLTLSPWDQEFWVSLMLSLGAGIHEEFFFRLIAIELFLRATLVFQQKPAKGWSPQAQVFALLGSSILFAAFHYIGPYGDLLDLDSFIFRTVSGIYLSVLYLVRGFGVAAWTHALYDIFLLAGIL